MPYAASSSRVVLSNLTASVDPRLVTAWPASLAPAATNAAMESVVPPLTTQDGGRPVAAAAAGVMGATGAPGAMTVRGSRWANGCRGWQTSEGLYQKQKSRRTKVDWSGAESRLLAGALGSRAAVVEGG